MTDYLKTFTDGESILASETNSNNQFLLKQIQDNAKQLTEFVEEQTDNFKQIVSSATVIGDIKLVAYQTAPDGWLICNGASLSVSDYAELYNKIGNAFGSEDDTHFNLPDFRDRVPEGYKDKNEAFGSSQNGKAPNITGYIDPYTSHSGASIGTRGGSGALYSTGSGTIISRLETGGGSVGIGFDASKSSSVYSNNANRITVDRVKINFLIKYKE